MVTRTHYFSDGTAISGSINTSIGYSYGNSPISFSNSVNTEGTVSNKQTVGIFSAKETYNPATDKGSLAVGLGVKEGNYSGFAGVGVSPEGAFAELSFTYAKTNRELTYSPAGTPIPPGAQLTTTISVKAYFPIYVESRIVSGHTSEAGAEGRMSWLSNSSDPRGYYPTITQYRDMLYGGDYKLAPIPFSSNSFNHSTYTPPTPHYNSETYNHSMYKPPTPNYDSSSYNRSTYSPNHLPVRLRPIPSKSNAGIH
jgi:hypothetical protein